LSSFQRFQQDLQLKKKKIGFGHCSRPLNQLTDDQPRECRELHQRPGDRDGMGHEGHVSVRGLYPGGLWLVDWLPVFPGWLLLLAVRARPPNVLICFLFANRSQSARQDFLQAADSCAAAKAQTHCVSIPAGAASSSVSTLPAGVVLTPNTFSLPTIHALVLAPSDRNRTG
jgi:hypothetical protein